MRQAAHGAGGPGAGSAPGLVGLLQVNLRVPGGYVPSGAVPLELTVGTTVSPDITIWVQ